MSKNKKWPDPPFDVKTVHDVLLRVHTKIEGGFKGTDEAGNEWTAMYEILEPSTVKVYTSPQLNAGEGTGKELPSYIEFKERIEWQIKILPGKHDASTWAKGKIEAYEQVVEWLKETEQLAPSPQIKADDWSESSEILPKEGGRYWCVVEELNDLGTSVFQWNCSYDPNTKTFSDNLKTMRVTHWRPLAPWPAGKYSPPSTQTEGEQEPEDIMKQLRKEAEIKYPFVWPKNKLGEEIEQRVGQNAPGSAKAKKIQNAYVSGGIAMYHRDQEELNQVIENAVAFSRLSVKQTNEIVALQSQLTEALHDTAVYKEWNTNAEKANTDLVDKLLKATQALEAITLSCQRMMDNPNVANICKVAQEGMK